MLCYAIYLYLRDIYTLLLRIYFAYCIILCCTLLFYVIIFFKCILSILYSVCYLSIYNIYNNITMMFSNNEKAAVEIPLQSTLAND